MAVNFNPAELGRKLTELLKSPGMQKQVRLAAEEVIEQAVIHAQRNAHGAERQPHEFTPTGWLTADEFNKDRMP